MRVDPEDLYGNSRWIKNVGLSQAVESSEGQAKTFEFHCINQEVTLKISKQTNADLAEMDRMCLEGRRKLTVMSQIMESWLWQVITEMGKAK